MFAIREMGRFYRHVLIEKNFPHHGAVTFGHHGKALFEVFKESGGNSRLFIAEMKARCYIVSLILYASRRSIVFY